MKCKVGRLWFMDEKEQGIDILKIAEIEKDVNPRRDRYC